MKCSHCAFENRDDARFCKQCGQPLASVTVICPNCGATAKPGARFCPRCGSPMPEAPPPPVEAPTRPAMRPPAGYTPPPAALPPTSPAHRPGPSRWLWVAIVLLLLLCLVGGVAAAVVFVPWQWPLLSTATATPMPGETPVETVPAPTETVMPPASSMPPSPSATPTTAPVPVTPSAEAAPPAFAAVRLAAPNRVQMGAIVPITATVTNNGVIPFADLRYQLLPGDRQTAFRVLDGAVAESSEPLLPGESRVLVLRLEATRVGTATLQANVTMRMLAEPPTIESVQSAVVTLLVSP